jgi:hypothetical protein
MTLTTVSVVVIIVIIIFEKCMQIFNVRKPEAKFDVILIRLSVLSHIEELRLPIVWCSCHFWSE